MELSREQIKEIRIEDLREAYKNIKKSEAEEGTWEAELIAIDNAIKFLNDQ